MKMNKAFAVMFAVAMQLVFCGNPINANEKVENETETSACRCKDDKSDDTLACRHCDGHFCDKCN